MNHHTTHSDDTVASRLRAAGFLPVREAFQRAADLFAAKAGHAPANPGIINPLLIKHQGGAQ